MTRSFGASLDLTTRLAKLQGAAKKTRPVVLGNDELGMVLVAPWLSGRNMDTSTNGYDGDGCSYLNEGAMTRGTAGGSFPGNFGGDSRTWFADEPMNCFPHGNKRKRTGKSWEVESSWDFTPYEILEVKRPDRKTITKIMMEAIRPITWQNYFGKEIKLSGRKNVELLLNPFGTDRELRRYFRQGTAGHVGYRIAMDFMNRGTEEMSVENFNAAAIWILGQFNPMGKTFWIAPENQGDGRQYIDYCFNNGQPMREGRAFARQGYFIKQVDGQEREKWGIPLARFRRKVGFIDLMAGELIVMTYGMHCGADAQILQQSWKDAATGKREYASKAFHPEQPIADGYNDGPMEPGKPSLGGFFEAELLRAYYPIQLGGLMSMVYSCNRWRAPAEVLLKIAERPQALGLDLRNEPLLK